MMRTKCSGGEICSKCQKDNATCAYSDRKRERNKKDLAESLDRVDLLELENRQLLDFLRTMSERPDFRSEDHTDVLQILDRVSAVSILAPCANVMLTSTQHLEQQNDDRTGTNSQSQSQVTHIGKPSSSGETKAASSVGSPGHQGELGRIVSLDLGGGASGFIGKISESSWVQRAFEQLRGHQVNTPAKQRAAEIIDSIATTTDFVYYMDDTNVLSINEDLVDQYHWPSHAAIVILSEACFHAMQGAFHFILREQFLQDVYVLSATSKVPDWSQVRGLALANLVWAVGAKWLQNTQLGQEVEKEDHLIYYARARALGLDHRVMVDHPDIERVQSIGLLAFYLLINGSITR
jgi:hypothetical protein